MEFVHPRATGFLQGRIPVALILSAFLLLTVPLICLQVTWGDAPTARAVALGFLLVFGATHFILTFSIYFQAANLRYFWSSWPNRVLFFLGPLAIFLCFDLYAGFRVALEYPLFNLAMLWGIRLLDFHHATRQGFGVLQLLKVRSKGNFPGWLRGVESMCFGAATLLMGLTYILGGTVALAHPAVQILAGATALLFVGVLAGFVLTFRRTERPGALLAPLCYVAIQMACVCLTAWSTAFYAACLATHYVEYHLLMMPRCFEVPLDESFATDRAFARLRRNKVIFYGVVLLVACGVFFLTRNSMAELFRQSGESSGAGYLLLISAFNGLFVFHYLVESFIWRFSDPHFRKILGPLYLGK